jgi:hypothetical protein
MIEADFPLHRKAKTMSTLINDDFIAPACSHPALSARSPSRLIREAYARGLSIKASPSPEQLMPVSWRVQLVSLIGAIAITGLIFSVIAFLIGATL